jgi:hypothetical protein
VLGAIILALYLYGMQQRRRAPAGTLFTAPAVIRWKDLARYGARRQTLERTPFRRPVAAYSGRLILTRETLVWKPDSYSRRHGGRSLVIPVSAVTWAKAQPRVFGLGALSVLGLRDGTDVALVTRGRPSGLRQGLTQAGVSLRH